MNKTLTKADIVDAVHEELDRNRNEVKNLVESLLAGIKDAVKNDSALLISGFGKFDAYAKKAQNGRNPQTKEAIILPARKVVAFRASEKLRNTLNEQKKATAKKR